MTITRTSLFLRTFLFVSFLLISLPSAQCQSGERDLDVYPYWKYYGDVSNILYKKLAERAFTQLDERKTHIESLRTKEDWLGRQQYVQSTLAEIVGPFPPRNPLNPVVTDTIRKDGIIIEKLYFESRPEYYVTAIFCYPEEVSGPLPAILFCSGHASEGFRSSTYQTMIFNYVSKGFAVLAFDPIGQGERIRYLDQEAKPRLSPTLEHSYPGSQTFLAGLSPANFFIWDGIRSVDYLLSRKEVDPDRIGITGRSGGGTQAAYIAAMDERIYASAPECYLTTFDKLLKSMGPQDAEQNLMNGIAKGIDIADYVEVRAPRPTLLVGTTRDIFSIQGFRDVYQEAQNAYSALGAAENIQKTEDDAGHASTVQNREATYGFFRKHLDNPGPVQDEEVPVLEPEELWVFPSGNVYQDLGGEDIFSLTRQHLEMQEPIFPDSHDDLRKRILEISGFLPLEDERDVNFSGRTQYDDFALEKYLVRGNGDYYLPVVWLKPHESSGKVILWVDESGKKSAARKGGAVDQWLKAGYSVVMPDLSGIGELGSGYQGGDARVQGVPLNVWYAGILTSRSLVAVHGEELSILRDFVGKSLENPDDLIWLGRGTPGSELLITAFVKGWTDRMILVDALGSYRSILDDPEYDARFLMASIPGSLTYFDLPMLMDAFGPDRILEVDPVDGDNERIPLDDIPNRISTTDIIDRFEKITQWLNKM